MWSERTAAASLAIARDDVELPKYRGQLWLRRNLLQRTPIGLHPLLERCPAIEKAKLRLLEPELLHV